MTDNQIIQMHDYAGNNQYPVTLASLVYDEDGETVSKKLALLLDWFEWGDEKKTSVKTKYPFWSEQQLGAGGIGEESEGGEGGIGTITGIKVNGEVWNEPDEFGVLTIPDYPTSLEWANIAGRPENLSEFTDDVVAGHYLPTSGGTIESAGIPLTVKRTNNPYSIISFYGIVDGTSQHFGYLGFSGVGEPIYMTSSGSERILIHSGNVGDYAIAQGGALTQSLKIYERLTDLWTIGGNSPYRLTISRSGGWASPLIEVFNNYNVDSPDSIVVAAAGGNGTINRIEFVQGADTADNTILRISKDNLQHRGHIILHEGNADEYAIAVNTSIDPATSYNVAGYGYTSSGWLSTGAAMIIGASANYRMAFQGTFDNGYSPELVYNYCYNGVWQNWRHIAFTDSTVAGARTLKDGAGNSIIYYRENSQLYIGDVIYADASTKLLGKNIYLASGESATTGLVLNSSGNVGIGTTAPAYKLDVNGIAYATYGLSASSVSINRNPSTGGILNTSLSALKIEAYASDVRVNVYKPTAAAATALTLFNNGSLGVGTTSYNGYLLDVAGTGRFANNLIVGGQVGIGTDDPSELLHVAGNIRLKNANNYGCSLKFGGKDYCYLYEDSDDHLNIYADNGIALLTNGKGVTTDQSLTIGSAVLSWDSVNNALKIEGNVYTTGQLSAGGVGTEVQKVFDIAAASNTTIANRPYTAYLTHNLNTYDLAVVVYEVTLQSDGITETLTQVLADVTLTDENKVTVHFASRKIGKKYRIVIIG